MARRKAPGAALTIGLALAAACDRPDGMTCLPPARSDGPIEISVAHPEGDVTASWYCEDPPPPELLRAEDYRLELIWVPGETCDPCDRETIASHAVAQVCDATKLPVRLLCGPVPHALAPWDREGCVYAVATDAKCQY